jgi:heme oxygenase
VTAKALSKRIEEKFDLGYHFKHVDTIFARVFGPGLPANYLNANQPSGNWRLLLERIDTILYRPDSLAVAIAAAREAFAAFERSGSKWLKEDSCPNRISKSI